MIVLASASPRRKELLSLLVKDFIVHPADIDETPLANELPQVYVERMALEKAQAVAKSLDKQLHANSISNSLIVASDTSVVIGQRIMGKPVGLADAQRMLTLLSGKTHQVMTSVCLLAVNSDKCLCNTVVTDVDFRHITETEIKQYWHTEEPKDKAGSYAIQGLGALFVKRISGSFSAVVGLPLYETAQLLQQFGVVPLREMTNE